MSVKPPEIPSLSTNVPPEVRRAFAALKGWIDALRTEGGAVTARTMERAIVETTGGNTALPAAPSDLVVAGAFNSILLTWGAARGALLYEIFRAEADDLGVAQKVGSTTALVYADTPPDSSLAKTYWYWVRGVSSGGTPGPFNATAGTPGSTADDPAYLLELLAGEITASQLHQDLNTLIVSTEERVGDLEEIYGDTVTASQAAAAAIIARNEAEGFATDADGYRQGAQTAAGAAQGSATAAAESATSAASSAGTAGTAATAANQAKLDAQAAQGGAESARGAAETARNEAVSASTDAEGSASQAALSATSAATAETAAGGSATAAAGSASAAASSATDAGNSASAAQAARVAAESARDDAQGAATAAAISASTANTRATEAGSSASAAISSATEAATSAGSASTFASQAATSAQDAADSAAAAAIEYSSLSTTVGGHTTTLEQQAQSIDGLEAQYTLKVDSNGFMSGFGLASEPVDGVPFSAFEFLGDRFAIVNPNVSPVAVTSLTRSGTQAFATTAVAHGRSTGDFVVIVGASPSGYNGTKPIVVTSTTTFTFTVLDTLATPAATAEGFAGIRVGHAVVPFVVQDGRVIMSEALIGLLTVARGAIKDLAVDDAKIASLSVAKLLAGIITASNIFLGASANVHLDGVNERIQIKNDADQVMVNIGKLGTGWGIEMFDAAGNLIFSTNSGGVAKTWATPGNVLVNALPHAAVAGVGMLPTDWQWSTTAEHNGICQVGVNIANGLWNLPGEFTPYIWQQSATSTGYQYFYLRKNNTAYPVEGGKRYEFSVYTGVHRCKGYVGISFYDANSGLLASFDSLGVSENNNEKMGGTVLGDFKRVGFFATAPANARWANLFIFKGATLAGQTDSYLFPTRAYFGEAGADQTELSPWSPGMHAGGPISTGNVSTFIEAAAIETLMANRVYVNTLNIGADAVTVNVSAEASSPFTVGTAWADLLTAYIDTVGQPLNVDAVGSFAISDGNRGATGSVLARIIDNGEVSPEFTVASWFVAEANNEILTLFATPGGGTFKAAKRYGGKSGTRTVTVQVRKSVANGTVQITSRNLLLQGTKR